MGNADIVTTLRDISVTWLRHQSSWSSNEPGSEGKFLVCVPTVLPHWLCGRCHQNKTSSEPWGSAKGPRKGHRARFPSRARVSASPLLRCGTSGTKSQSQAIAGKGQSLSSRPSLQHTHHLATPPSYKSICLNTLNIKPNKSKGFSKDKYKNNKQSQLTWKSQFDKHHLNVSYLKNQEMWQNSSVTKKCLKVRILFHLFIPFIYPEIPTLHFSLDFTHPHQNSLLEPQFTSWPHGVWLWLLGTMPETEQLLHKWQLFLWLKSHVLRKHPLSTPRSLSPLIIYSQISTQDTK